jgi:cytidylate kinase
LGQINSADVIKRVDVIITIDGAAASGKSTVGARLAESLDYLYFDTGVMYRAVTWAALDRDIDPRHIEEVSIVAETLLIEVNPNGSDQTGHDGRQYTVLADSQDITWAIRNPAVEQYVSLVSSYPRVRTALTEQQRRIAAAGRVVMVGRDIGTVVLPDADLKIFLRASAAERARRRYQDNQAQGQKAGYEEILAAIQERDKQDIEKPISPLVPAEDAIIVNTDGLSVDEVVAQLQQLVAAKSASSLPAV